MQLPTIRFTLGHLLKLIAILAVALALLRMPFGPLLLVTGLVLAGFAIDRSRGGVGFRGGILASVLAHLAIGLIGRATHQFLFEDPSALSFSSTLAGLIYYVFVGWIWGVMISLPAWMVVSVNWSWSGEKPEADKSSGPFVPSDFEHRDLEPARPGGQSA